MKYHQLLIDLRNEFANTIYDDYDRECFLRSPEELYKKYANESKAKLLGDHCEIHLEFLKWLARIK